MLKGKLCTVRHLLAADLNTFLILANDLSARGNFFSSQLKSPEVMRRDFMQTGFATEDSEMLVIEDSQHHLIGVITHFKGRTALCREIGYQLFDQALAGRGYITEASRLLVDYLFNAYPYHRLELLMDARNTASERVAQKCGFRAEGILRQAFFINGAIRDVKLYSLLRPEWQARQSDRAATAAAVTEPV